MGRATCSKLANLEPRMSEKPQQRQKLSPWREKIHEIIFEADTPAGAAFDISLLIAIIASVVVICLETVSPYNEQFADELFAWKWGFTILFTVEYFLRLICVRRPLRYMLSFWGIVDLLSFLPDYLLLGGVAKTNAFSVIRSLRLLRVFRIFKLAWFQHEADELGSAVYRSRAKIVVFLTAVLIIVTVTGTLMYEIESNNAPPGECQFDSIPEGIYWAIVTMTTVGFGDIVPVTTTGKFLSAFLILVGYSLIIVPTGFVSAEIIESKKKTTTSTISCGNCITEGHDADAVYCKYCGSEI